MNLETVKQDINAWIENFVEVSHTALGNWPPCPYARNARLNNEYEVRVGTSPLPDLITIATAGFGDKKVIVLAYDPVHWTYEQFHHDLEYAYTEFLLDKDIIALEDHPADPEIVNGDVVPEIVFPSLEVTVYPVIADPPLFTGAVNVTTTLSLPEATATIVGASGTVVGVTGKEAVEAADVPIPLVAVTLKV